MRNFNKNEEKNKTQGSDYSNPAETKLFCVRIKNNWQGFYKTETNKIF